MNHTTRHTTKGHKTEERVAKDNTKHDAHTRRTHPSTPPIFMTRPKPLVPRRLVAVIATTLFIVIVYGALLAVMHQRALYTHITDPTLQQENARVLQYINGPIFGENTLDFLTTSERTHMTDVKRLFDALFIIYIVSLGIIIGTVLVFATQRAWARFDELLARSLRAAGWTLAGACMFFGAAAMLDFTKFWMLFHALLFPQGNWTFPSESILITLYPSTFFAQYAMRVFIYIIGMSVMFIILSTIMLRMRTAEHHFNEIWERKKR